MDLTESNIDVIPKFSKSLIIGPRGVAKTTLVLSEINQILEVRPIEKLYVISHNNNAYTKLKKIHNRIYSTGFDKGTFSEITNSPGESIFVMDDVLLKADIIEYICENKSVTILIISQSSIGINKAHVQNFDYVFLGRDLSLSINKLKMNKILKYKFDFNIFMDTMDRYTKNFNFIVVNIKEQKLYHHINKIDNPIKTKTIDNFEDTFWDLTDLLITSPSFGSTINNYDELSDPLAIQIPGLSFILTNKDDIIDI
jgi:hypothetical protein